MAVAVTAATAATVGAAVTVGTAAAGACLTCQETEIFDIGPKRKRTSLSVCKNPT